MAKASVKKVVADTQKNEQTQNDVVDTSMDVDDIDLSGESELSDVEQPSVESTSEKKLRGRPAKTDGGEKTKKAAAKKDVAKPKKVLVAKAKKDAAPKAKKEDAPKAKIVAGK